MIPDFFLAALDEMDLADVWFQQDGATAHTARIFFLWGYLKSKVYNGRPRTLEALRNNIAEIPVGMLRKVHDTFRKRLNQCVQSEGAHLSDTLFKTI